MIVAHIRDPMKNCENTLIERTPKTIFVWKLLTLFLIQLPNKPKQKYPLYVVENILNSRSSCFMHLEPTQSRNEKWNTTGISLNSPIQVWNILKAYFPKWLEDMNQYIKDQEAIQKLQKVMCGKLLKHYLMNLIHIIGVSLSEPHIYALFMKFACLSVCLLVCMFITW